MFYESIHSVFFSRMQAEMKMPGQKSRYTGVFNAYYTIGKFEGMAGLYKGILKSNGFYMESKIQIK